MNKIVGLADFHWCGDNLNCQHLFKSPRTKIDVNQNKTFFRRSHFGIMIRRHRVIYIFMAHFSIEGREESFPGFSDLGRRRPTRLSNLCRNALRPSAPACNTCAYINDPVSRFEKGLRSIPTATSDEDHLRRNLIRIFTKSSKKTNKQVVLYACWLIDLRDQLTLCQYNGLLRELIIDSRVRHPMTL